MAHQQSRLLFWALAPALLVGIGAHDLYHAGQIQLLKRLAAQALR